jgi:RNA polymerase sigma-70 factor (ECF subfamily)
MAAPGRAHAPRADTFQPEGARPPAMNFREVYDEHFHFVWRTLRQFGVQEKDTPDAVQEVFVVVHRKLPTFEGRSKLRTWLFGICVRVASDRRRLAHVRREVPDEATLEAHADEAAGPAQHLERRQAFALLEAALAALPDEQRAVFILFELHEVNCEEIAEALTLPLGTVYSRLRLAREAFRKALTRLHAKARAQACRLGEAS